MTVKKSLLVCSIASMAVCGCVQNPSDPVAKCINGTFVGQRLDNGVVAFKGIPYAKAPVGDLRWKAPQAPDPSDQTFDAKEFGLAALQAYSPSEVASSGPKGENCLTLNVWTKDLSTKGKPVLFWIHGGSYSYGGTVDPLYDGKCLAYDYPDVVFVTANYRVNMMGFIDFSHVPGGENFPDAPYLGIMDQQAALRWVKQNIEAFGGDPDNVTIFGESAGGGSVSCHLVAKGSEDLFQHAIVMSGPVDLTFTQKVYDQWDQAGWLLKITGCKNMDELMALSEDDLLKAMETDTGVPGMEGLSTLAGHNNHPLRDDRSIIPYDPFTAIAQGASKDVDLIVGTTWEEAQYWAHLFHYLVPAKDQPFVLDKNTDDPLGSYYNICLAGLEYNVRKSMGKNEPIADKFIASVRDRQDEMSAKYPLIWERTEFLNEMRFRIGSILMAQNHAHAGGKGKTYMYFFGKAFDESAVPDEPWLGACHACELTYALDNKDYPEGGFHDPQLMKNFSGAIVAFAKNGDPSLPNIPWPQYDSVNRNTMIIGRDASMYMESDPKKDQREMLLPIFYDYWINQ